MGRLRLDRARGRLFFFTVIYYEIMLCLAIALLCRAHVTHTVMERESETRSAWVNEKDTLTGSTLVGTHWFSVEPPVVPGI